uniref:G-protein coupled receptors family 3 profile domain-containing protein n=1 Tax=Xenopus tropicalis TaxID=8364 RepID=A0A1B8Y9R5_XENTR
MFLLLTLFVLLHIHPVAAASDPHPRSGCVLRKDKFIINSKAGDLVIAAFLQLNDVFTQIPFLFDYGRGYPITCGLPLFRYFRHRLAFIFAIEEINRSLWILPNVTLGYQIFDSCASEVRSVSGTLNIMSGAEHKIPNYNCQTKSKLISYGATDPVFNDRTQFPSFYRTIPNEEAEMDGIVQILKHFGWKWVGLIISDDATGYRGRERISKELAGIGGCLAFSSVINSITDTNNNDYYRIIQDITETTANVIVVFISTKFAFNFAHYFVNHIMPRKVWVMTSFFPSLMVYREFELGSTFNGSLSLLIQEGEIPGFEDFINNFSLNNFPKDDDIVAAWEHFLGCVFSNTLDFYEFKTCTGNESLRNAYLFVYENYRVTYRVYTAVYALARALHNLYSAQPPANHWGKLEHLKRKVNPWQFFLPNDLVDISKIGYFNTSKNKKYLYINNSADLWSPNFSMVPESLCNAPCAPGFWKSKIEGRPSCCYDCAQCADGEMSNTTDAVDCMKCPEDQKPNRQRTDCVPKAINYLSYMDTLGASLASIALVFSITASVVLGISVKYWETPIVRANNQNLSCLLLISLMLCFLCTLLFIGRPTQICCLLRQVTFGIVFTISVSSVLAKTLTVIIAFNATKPGSKLKKYVGTQLSVLVVFTCSSGETAISVAWIVSSPPFPDTDTSFETDIFLQCNEGSVTFFFCIIGYIGTLALLSFIAAFLAKDFPDRFNEAKNITFSMLGFCSVWGAFVPAYLSSKGSRMVAVEIFAILSSSAGLLICIFAPKCYIIFIRPELNKKENCCASKRSLSSKELSHVKRIVDQHFR